ncbi:tetratricopeptide repeat protein [Lysobacter sp. A286]
MDAERWLRAKEILGALDELAPDQRAARIAEACGDDAGLRAEVERLVALDDEADSYFGELRDALGQGEVAQPEQVGVYRIIREIGRGGMGTVYLGERNDGQFKQEVAIKVVRHGIGGNLLERFRDERRILAQLKHPGIAYLLDGGSLADGRPYFVMEYVQGESITTYANHKQLDVHARLGLFRDVCAAVAHAHRSLVIHRDLKPANVMVQEDRRGDATIKLLDFGIARIIAEGLGDDADDNERDGDGEAENRPVPAADLTARASTQHGERLLTPRYAAPEQIRGEKATMASDVYALGLLLHELLTGTHPFGAAVSTPGDMQRAILEDSPALPSLTASREDAAVAALRGTTPGKLARQLRGDLDSIVLKAIHRDPDQRYASVGQLADDIRRHIDGETVTARQGTATYRAGVFLRRHRRGVAAAALVLIAAVASAALHVNNITHERDLARIEATKARQVTGLLVSMLESADPAQARGEEISVREVLEQASDRMQTELADQPDVRAKMDAIIGAVYTSLGKYEEAETLLTRALALQRDRHGPNHPEALDTMQAMATLALRRQQDDKAETLLRDVLAGRLELAHPDPLQVASTQHDLGGALQRQGKNDEAETLLRAALATASTPPGAAPEALMAVRNTLAVLLVAKGEFEEAEKYYRLALAQQRELLGPVHPSLATTLSNLGVLLTTRQRFPEAEPLMRESLAMTRKLFDDNHPEVAAGMGQLAALLTRLERYDEAESLLQQALAMRRATLEPGHPHIAVNLNNLANLYRGQGDYVRAEPLYGEAIAIIREAAGAEHPWTSSMIGNQGAMYLLADNASAAEEALRESLRIRQKNLPGDHWKVADTQSLLGEALAAQGQLDAAEPLLKAGYATLQQALGENDPHTRAAKTRLADLQELRKTPTTQPSGPSRATAPASVTS